MRILIIAAVVTSILASVSWAQEPPKESPELLKCQQDNELLRATIYVIRTEEAQRQEREGKAVLEGVRRQQQQQAPAVPLAGGPSK